MENQTKSYKQFLTIGVSPTTKARLEALKLHPRQSHDEVIEELIKLKEALNNTRTPDKNARAVMPGLDASLTWAEQGFLGFPNYNLIKE